MAAPSCTVPVQCAKNLSIQSLNSFHNILLCVKLHFFLLYPGVAGHCNFGCRLHLLDKKLSRFSTRLRVDLPWRLYEGLLQVRTCFRGLCVAGICEYRRRDSHSCSSRCCKCCRASFWGCCGSSWAGFDGDCMRHLVKLGGCGALLRGLQRLLPCPAAEELHVEVAQSQHHLQYSRTGCRPSQRC